MARLITLISVSILLFAVSAYADATFVGGAWDFEDGGPGGITADVSGVSPALNGTLCNGAAIIDDPCGVRGKVLDPNNAHNGLGGCVLGTNAKLWAASGRSITMQYWHYATNPEEQWKYTFGAGQGTRMFNMNGGFLCELSSNDSGWAPLNIYRGDYANPQVWHHVLVTYDGYYFYGYIDGVEVQMKDDDNNYYRLVRGGTINTNTNYWSIGRTYIGTAGGSWHAGKCCSDLFDDVAIWKGYASPAVALGLYNGTYTIHNAPIMEFEYAAIEGTITDGSDPIQGLTVVAYNQDFEEIDSTITDANGEYQFVDLDNGSYYIAALPSNTGMHYVNQYYNDTTNSADADLVVIPGPILRSHIDFELDPSGAITGTVLDNDGNPIEGIAVTADDQETLSIQTTTDANGEYSIGVPAGDYIVSIDDGDYPKMYYNNTYYLASAADVTVTGTSTTPDIDFSMTPYIVLTAQKCTVNKGKTDGFDSFSLSGTYSETIENINDANEIDVTITSNTDNHEVYSESISFNPASISNNKYSYSHKYPKASAGGITSLKFDTAKKTFSMAASNIDLTGLRCPILVKIGFGDASVSGQVTDANSTLSAQITETVANGRKPVPMLLLKGYDNDLRVDSVIATSTSLWVKGAIASQKGGDGRHLDKFDFSRGGTVAAWIKPTRTDESWRYIFGPGGDGPRLFQMNNEIKFGTTVDPGQWGLTNITSSGANLEAGNWYHIVGVYYHSSIPNASYMRLYVNGEELASIVNGNCSNNLPKVVTCPFTIGNDINADSGGFRGRIDDVAVFNYALTSPQVTRLMNGTYVNDAAHWDFEDGTGSTTAEDISRPIKYVPAANGVLLGTTSIVSDSNEDRDLVLSCDGDPGNYVDCNRHIEDLSLNNVTVTWGNKTFTLNADKTYYRKGNFIHYSNSTGKYGATFDFDNCTFVISIRESSDVTTSGTVRFGLSFDEFDESVDVGL